MRHLLGLLVLAPVWLWVVIWAGSAVRTKLRGGSLLRLDTPPTRWDDDAVDWHRRNAARDSGRTAV